MTYQQFISKYNVKFSQQWISQRPDGMMDANMNHYKCLISANPEREFLTTNGWVTRRQRRQMSLYFSQGLGITTAPDLANVLDCLASDASGYENAQSFEDWASEYGYDTDSRKAEKIYRTIKRQAEQLKRTLGEDAYNELLWKTERL